MIPVLVGAALGLTVAKLTQPRAGRFEVTVPTDPITESRSMLCTASTTLTADEIYRRVRGGPGSGSLVDANVATKTLAQRYLERATQIELLRSQMAASWQGSAADASFAHTQPLREAFDRASTLLQDSARPLWSQVDAFQQVYAKVEEVPSDPPKSNLLNDLNPFRTNTDAAIEAYNARASKNVQAYREYNSASTDNSAELPQEYPALPVGDVPEVAVEQTGPTTAAYGASPPGTSPASTMDTAPVRPVDAPGSPVRPSDQPVAPAASLPSPPNTTTTPQRMAPEPSTARGVMTPTGPTPGAAPVAGPVTGGHLANPRPGAGGRNTPVGGPRPGPIGGASPTGQPSRGATPATGGPRAAATAGPTGLPVSGGRAKGEEDTEHRRKYVTSADDPKSLFGTDEPYVEPVIGDSR